VEASHDGKGIIWPESVAPFKYHLLEQNPGEAKGIYERLVSDGEEVLYDDREVSLGQKFQDADLMGIPVRLLVSARTNGKVELKKRNEDKTETLDYEDIRKF
jgi:prolyl-tRNA synthetase